MNDPTDLIDPIVGQTKRTLTEMKKTSDLGERKVQSEIVENLCKSLGVFFEVMSNAMQSPDLADFFDDEDDEEEDDED